MANYKKLIKEDLGETKKTIKHDVLNDFFNSVIKFINKIIDFLKNLFKFLKSKFTSKSIRKENSSNIEMHNVDHKKLVDDTLKYINVLIGHEKNINEIRQSKLSDKTLQPIIAKNNIKYENDIKAFGFVSEDGECDYNAFFQKTVENVKKLNLETPKTTEFNQFETIFINDYAIVKTQLEDIVKNNYQEQSENQEESKWQDKVKKNNNNPNRDSLIYGGL